MISIQSGLKKTLCPCGRRRSRAGPRRENVSQTGEIESCET
jgi:hypothetical protein